MHENDQTAYGDRPTVGALIDEEEMHRYPDAQTTESPQHATIEWVSVVDSRQ